MNRRVLFTLYAIALIAGALKLGDWISSSPDTGLTILVGLLPAVVCIAVLLKEQTDRIFLLRVFALAISLRWALALLINWQHMQSFFGADAGTFDEVGWAISNVWRGLVPYNSPWMADYTNHTRPGWGMFYFVAALYYMVGRDQLLIQLINCAFGAASCIVVYKIAQMIYPQPRVARTAALFAAISPSLILWSSQALKDGPIVLSLSLCALFTLKLQAKFGIKNLLFLLASLFCLFSLRNYAFYLMFAAVALALLLAGKRFSPVRFIQG
ncbi:MAG TPA: glycosyltransferase family 39 protein, partial [Blastocatellia bacterium]|nr:glycosyltransferase family 39 protein [Blastocatellia bacterium]